MAAKCSYKPVQSIGCDLIDVAIAPAGRADRDRVSDFLCELAWEGMKVIGPILQLVLPDANKLRGRVPDKLGCKLARDEIGQSPGRFS